MRKLLIYFCHVFFLSAFMNDPCAADEWNAGSTSVKWQGPNSSTFDGATFFSFRQDAIGIPNQTSNCNRRQVKTIEIADAAYIPKKIHYAAQTDGAISSEGLVDFSTSPRENKILVKVYLVQKSVGIGNTCEGPGSVNHSVTFYESESEKAGPGSALAPTTPLAQSALEQAPAANPAPPKKGSWQAALMDMLPSTNAGRDGGRVTGIKLDETPRTIADYGGAAEIGFADKQNVSVFLFRAPRKGQSDAWVVSTIADLSPVTKEKAGFDFSWHKVANLDGTCLRVANGAGQVNVVCGIYDVELPIIMTVSGNYAGRQEDRVPMATLQALFDRLMSARNLIFDTVYDL